MTIFPPYINATPAATPVMPPLEEAPEQLQKSFHNLRPYETRLSDDGLYRFLATLFPIVGPLFRTLPEGETKHYSAKKLHLDHAITIVRFGEEAGRVLVHFNKSSDGHKVSKGERNISPVIDMETGRRYAWVTPTHSDVLETTSFKHQIPFLRSFNGETPGVVSTRALDIVQGSKRTKPALIQDWGLCDLKELLYDSDSQEIKQLVERVPYLQSKDGALFLMVKLLQGLTRVHQKNILHNDLCPRNIILVEKDGMIEPKIIDFDRSLSFEECEYVTEVQGSYGYLASEMYTYASEYRRIEGRDSPSFLNDEFPGYTPAKDVWALGHVLHELFFGIWIDPASDFFLELVSHFTSEDPSPSLQAIAARGPIEAFIASLLHQNPKMRPTAPQALETLCTIILEQRD